MKLHGVWRHGHEGGSTRAKGITVGVLLVSLTLGLDASLPQNWSCCSALPGLLAIALAEDVPPAGTTDVYQYTDAHGVIHFVDTLEKVPRHYRDRLIVRRDSPVVPAQTTMLQMADNRILVPVTLRNGDREVQAQLILDTGTSLTSITEECAARLNITPEATSPVTMGLADGRMIEIRIMTIDAVAVGKQSKSHFEIGILPHSDMPELQDGLLGLDFFQEFSYQIDVANGVIRWQ